MIEELKKGSLVSYSFSLYIVTDIAVESSQSVIEEAGKLWQVPRHKYVTMEPG